MFAPRARAVLAVLLLVALAPAARPAEPTQEEARRALASLKATLDFLAADLRRPGADPLDLDHAVAVLGYDAGRIAAFVTDEVRTLPYAGVLRGPDGTWLARAGNPVDQALLLRDLLRRAGHPARLRRGRLPEEAAAALVDRFLTEEPPPAPPADTPIDEEWLGRFTAATGIALDPDGPEARERRARGAEILADTLRAADRECAALLDVLQRNDVTLGRPAADWRAGLIANVRDYAWVVVDEGPLAGRPLHPALEADTAAKLAIDDATDVEPGDLPGHTLHFELVHRSRPEGGESEAKVILEARFAAAEALRDPIGFRIQAVGSTAPKARALFEAANPDEARRALAGVEEFLPLLRKGRRLRFGLIFDLKGNLREQGGGYPGIAGAQEAGKNVKRAFERALEIEEKKPPKRILESLTVRLTSESPGGGTRVQERLLWEPDATCGGGRKPMPMLDWQMLYTPQPVHPDWYAHGSTQAFVEAYRPLLEQVTRPEVTPAVLDEQPPRLPRTWPQALIHLGLVLDGALGQRAREQGGVRVLHDRPRLFVLERTACLGGPPDRACACITADLVENGVAVVPVSDDHARAAAELGIWSGVHDTVGEAMLVQLSRDGGEFRSALTTWERARLGGAGAVVATPSEPGPLADSVVSRDDRAWIARHEPRDRHLVAPRGSAEGDLTLSVWWSVDAREGVALGRGRGGRGSALTEEAILIRTMIRFLICNADAAYDIAHSQDQGRAAIGRFLMRTTACTIFLGAGVALAEAGAATYYALSAGQFVMNAMINQGGGGGTTMAGDVIAWLNQAYFG